MPDLITADLETPLGALALICDGGLVALCEFADRPERVARQLMQYYGGQTPAKAALPADIRQAFEAYFGGDGRALDGLETAPLGTVFERRVWRALRDIPAGQTTSYGALAGRLGSSPRAIGRANGRNPICLIQPCHRVIGMDGSLTGYAGGLERKAWLLAHEGVGIGA